jgi:hypothetical protein
VPVRSRAGLMSSIACFFEVGSSKVSRWLADRFTPTDDSVGRWENDEDEDGRTDCSEERVGPGGGDVSASRGAFSEVEDAVRAS